MGTAAASPYEITWQNEWIPDQPGPMKFAARIIDKDGLIYMTPAADNLTLKRNYSVELCKPDPASIPQAWVTRKGVKGEEFSVGGDLTKATSALSKVVVWQHQGIALQYTFGTGEKVTCNESKTPNVVAKAAVPAKALTQGKNTLKTQGTESGHHGVEVQWPGVVILVRYSEPTKTINNLHFAAKPLINVPANMTASQLSLMAHSGMKIYSVTGSGKTVGSTSDIPNGTYIIHLPDNTCRHVTVLQQ